MFCRRLCFIMPKNVIHQREMIFIIIKYIHIHTYVFIEYEKNRNEFAES